MKILHWTDTHYLSMRLSCRKDDFPEAMFAKTVRVLDLAVKEKVDLLLHTGDVYHSGRLSKVYENRLIHLFGSYQLRYAAVIGNHDIRYADASTVNRLPLGTLFASKVFSPSPPEFMIETDDTVIVLMPYSLNPEGFQIPTKKKVVLGAHFFLQSGYADGAENLPEGLINEADFILLGHDHTPYEICRMGRAQISRPGALSRGTRAEVEWKRPVLVAIVDTEEGTIRYIPIPVAPAEEIFSKERMVSEGAIREAKIIDDLMVSVTAEENVPQLLEQLTMPPAVRERVTYWLREFAII